MEEKKERKPRSGLRGMSRFCAVQTMYKSELCGCSIDKIIDEFNKSGEAFISENISVTKMDRIFFKLLLISASSNLLVIDKIISEHLSEKWKLERIDSVTRNILRLGVAELLYFKDIPANVIFNEYIEISKAFFESREVSFINSLLNVASQQIRM
jgi:N utilization substance protein B